MTLGGGGWKRLTVNHGRNCIFYFKRNKKPLKDFMQGNE